MARHDPCRQRRVAVDGREWAGSPDAGSRGIADQSWCLQGHAVLPCSRLFFVYHTGRVSKLDHERVILIGPSELAPLVVDAGLLSWLIEKVSQSLTHGTGLRAHGEAPDNHLTQCSGQDRYERYQ